MGGNPHFPSLGMETAGKGGNVGWDSRENPEFGMEFQGKSKVWGGIPEEIQNLGVENPELGVDPRENPEFGMENPKLGMEFQGKI